MFNNPFTVRREVAAMIADFYQQMRDRSAQLTALLDQVASTYLITATTHRQQIEKDIAMLTQALTDLTAAVKRNADASQKELSRITLFLQNNNPNDDSVAAGVIESAVAELNKAAIAMETEADAIQLALDKAASIANQPPTPQPPAEPKA